MIENILVLGGTGFVGRSVCEKLVERSGGAGGRILVPTRHPERGKHLQMLPTLELLPADLHDDAQKLSVTAPSFASASIEAEPANVTPSIRSSAV